MNYCYSIKKGLFDTEKKYVKEELGTYVFYDEGTDLFYDNKDNIIDISGMNLFLRTGILQYTTLVDAVSKHNGIPINTKEQNECVLDWPNYAKTKRRNILLTGEEILNTNKVKEIFNDEKVFFKTRNKNYSSIIKVSDICEDTNLRKVIERHKDESFIISEPVNIKNDGLSPLEYRFFIVDRNILNVSRIHNGLLETIDDSIIDKAKEVIDSLDYTWFPNNYVLDLFIYEKDGKDNIDILEFNEIETSGTYLYNSPIIKEYDIKHTCPSASIPREKTIYNSVRNLGFNAVSDSTPSVLYELPGGFAGDLLSLTMFGNIDSSNSYMHIETNESSSLDLLNRLLLSESDFKPLPSKFGLEEVKDDEALTKTLKRKQ